jgi:hypothetical protein
LSIRGREGIEIDQRLDAEVRNTPARLKASAAWSAQLAKHITRLPDSYDGFCDFDPNSLPN